MIPAIRAAGSIVLLVAVATAARAQAATGKDAWCSATDSVQVTSSTVASFFVSDPIATLRRKCPTARDTSYAGESDRYPALSLPFPGATIVAVQFADSLISSSPPDIWILTGSSIVLPGGLRLTGSWGAFRRAYGTAKGTAESLDRFAFEFCRMPGIVLEVDVAQESDSLADAAWPGTIRGSAKIIEAVLGTHLDVPRPCR